jgi:hypothetical protein
MRKVSIFTVCLLGLAVIAPVLTSFNQSPAGADSLEKELSVLQAELNRRMEMSNNMGNLRKAAVLGAATFECTGGKNPAQMTNIEYLKAFAAGPCTPLVAMAGISGTKLKLSINCAVLKSQRPDVFSGCGWSSCERSMTSLLSYVPREEYNLWVPELTAPFSLINPTSKSNICMSNLLGFKWATNNGLLVTPGISGITVTAMGLTESTRLDSKCGFDSMSNLLPLLDVLTPRKYKMFEILRTSLEARGYKVGLTLQALPYDWRKTFYSNDITDRFERVVTDMYRITGKKVSFAAHSMGNMNMLNMMKNFSQDKKDRMIQRYFALAPPYLGSPTTFSMLISGGDSYYFAGFGLNFYTFKRTVATFPSMYDLMPRRLWTIYRDAPWLKSVVNRIKIERGISPPHVISADDDIVTKIFPATNKVCYPNDWNDGKSQYCKTEMEELNNIGSINSEQVTVDNISEMLGKYSFEPLAITQYNNQGRRGSYDTMINPGIQTVLLFSSINKTPITYQYKNNPKIKTLPEDAPYVKPDFVTESFGDGSVLAVSTLVPGFKWAYEFDKKLPNSKPVIFAEICSNYNLKNSVYQSGKSVTSNQYFGIGCTCKKGGEKACDHVGLVSDQQVVDFIANSLMDSQAVHNDRYFPASVAEATIKNYVDRCSLVFGN